jgi:hypothetical protein
LDACFNSEHGRLGEGDRLAKTGGWREQACVGVAGQVFDRRFDSAGTQGVVSAGDFVAVGVTGQ